MAIAPDLEALRTTRPQLLLDRKQRDYYPWVLLEDHPLRSYPDDVDCHPDISLFGRKCYAAVRKRWREYGLPTLSVLFMFLVIVRFLLLLPRFASYFLEEPVSFTDSRGFIQLAAGGQSIEHGHGRICADSDLSSQIEGVEVDAVEHALRSGCTGVKVELWLRDSGLYVAPPSPASVLRGDDRTLQDAYLMPLLDKLDALNNLSFDHATSVSPVGLFGDDPLQTFTLFIEVRTPMRTAWPWLVALLEELNQHGYLSYYDGRGLVLRPVTVVVRGGGGGGRGVVDGLVGVLRGLV
ncbi:hypothetical protein BJX61DRAFT_551963 [Aspergillus egyptiacus]|nr:hypothetical protein BJX61DRAFT_551963 [Aspergillus egyptiacus]